MVDGRTLFLTNIQLDSVTRQYFQDEPGDPVSNGPETKANIEANIIETTDFAASN